MPTLGGKANAAILLTVLGMFFAWWRSRNRKKAIRTVEGPSWNLGESEVVGTLNGASNAGSRVCKNGDSSSDEAAKGRESLTPAESKKAEEESCSATCAKAKTDLLAETQHPERGTVIIATRDISEATKLLTEPPFFRRDHGMNLEAIYQDFQKDPPKMDAIVKLFMNENSSEYSANVRLQAQVLFPELQADDLDKFVAVVSALHINAAEIVCGSDTVGQALFSFACKISHSCEPNCFWYTKWLDQGVTFSRVVRSIEEIKAGEEITVSYIGEEQLILPAPQRQQILLENFGFLCSCSRCEAEVQDVRCFHCPQESCSGRVNVRLSPISLQTRIGKLVILVGLQRSPQLNGACGALGPHDASTGRWQVKLQASPETKMVLGRNIRVESLTMCNMCKTSPTDLESKSLLDKERLHKSQLEGFDDAINRDRMVDPFELVSILQWSPLHPHHYLSRLLGILQYDFYLSSPFGRDQRRADEGKTLQAECILGCRATRSRPSNTLAEAANNLLHFYSIRDMNSCPEPKLSLSDCFAQDLANVVRYSRAQLIQQRICYGHDAESSWEIRMLLMALKNLQPDVTEKRASNRCLICCSPATQCCVVCNDPNICFCCSEHQAFYRPLHQDHCLAQIRTATTTFKQQQDKGVDQTRLKIRDRVVLTGLKRIDLNGRFGVVNRLPSQKSERYGVVLSRDAQLLSLKPANLFCITRCDGAESS